MVALPGPAEGLAGPLDAGGRGDGDPVKLLLLLMDGVMGLMRGRTTSLCADAWGPAASSWARVAEMFALKDMTSREVVMAGAPCKAAAAAKPAAAAAAASRFMVEARKDMDRSPLPRPSTQEPAISSSSSACFLLKNTEKKPAMRGEGEGLGRSVVGGGWVGQGARPVEHPDVLAGSVRTLGSACCSSADQFNAINVHASNST